MFVASEVAKPFDAGLMWGAPQSASGGCTMFLVPRHLLGINFRQSPVAQEGHASPESPPAAQTKAATAPQKNLGGHPMSPHPMLS